MPIQKPIQEAQRCPIEFKELIQLILAVSEMGCEAEKIKLSFPEYFNLFIKDYIKDPLLRQKLRTIPVVLKPPLDLEQNKIMTIQNYRSAVIQLILNDLRDKQHAKFFEIQKLEIDEAHLLELIKEIRADNETRLRLENYIKLLAQQNKELELMALELSLMMRLRMESLEKQQLEMIGQISRSIYAELEKELKTIFNNLVDNHGNPVILSETEQQNIIGEIIKEYTDSLADYCIDNTRVHFNGVPGAQPPKQGLIQGLFNKHQNQESHLFNNFTEHHPNKLAEIAKKVLKSRNIDHANNESGINALKECVSKGLKKRKNQVSELVKVCMAKKAVIKERKEIQSQFRIESAIDNEFGNMFSNS